MFATFKMLISIITLLLSIRLAGSELNPLLDNEQGEKTFGDKDFRAVFSNLFRCETDSLPDPGITFITVLAVTCLLWLAHLVYNRNKSAATKHFRFSKLGNTCSTIGRKRCSIASGRKNNLNVIHGTRAFNRRKKMRRFPGSKHDKQITTKGVKSTSQSTFAYKIRFSEVVRNVFTDAQLCVIYFGLSKYPINTYRERFDEVREEMRSLLKPATYIGLTLDNREVSIKKTRPSIFDTTFDLSVVQKNFIFFGNDMVSVYQFGSLVLTKMLWDKANNYFHNQQRQVRCGSNNALSTEV